MKLSGGDLINVISIIGAFAGTIPVFFILIILARRFWPQADHYFSVAKPVIAEIDDLIDKILLEWDNNTLETVNDVIGQVRRDLARAGYKLDDKENAKIENHAKALLKRKSETPEGLSISRDENNELKINYKKDF